MSEQNMNKKKLKLVRSDGSSLGGERKQRRLAATIAAPEADRPRLPAQADTAEIFDTIAWRRRWGAIRGVAETTNVYVAGCTGSMRLAGEIGMPVLKPGTAQDVDARIAKLNGERHGSLVIRDFAVVDEPGWSDWELAKLSCSPDPPGVARTGHAKRQLVVALPFWVTGRVISRRSFVAALEPVTLAVHRRQSSRTGTGEAARLRPGHPAALQPQRTGASCWRPRSR